MKYMNPGLAFAAAALILAAAVEAQPPENPPVPTAGQAAPAKQDPTDSSNKNSGTAPMDTGASSLVEGDRTFLLNVAMADMTEIAASNKATASANPHVAKFARMMVADHTKNSEELKQLADSKHVQLPSDLDAQHSAAVAALPDAPGKDFDAAYVKAMVADHKEAVSLFDTEAKGGTDADVKGFAMTTLPTLKHHKRMAKKLAAKLHA